MRFDELRLSEPIVRAVADEGYETPTPIQAEAIPHVLAGRDVLGCARTGTGKTAAFALPILHRLAGDLEASPTRTPGRRVRRRGPGGDGADAASPLARGRSPRALVLAPTRELATQIRDSFESYGRHLPLVSTVVFGGVSQFRQEKAARAGIDVLVATPGRLLDLVGQRVIDLSKVEVLVLDEADHMLDMGFIPDVRRIVERVPKARQTLLFSATMPPEIRRLADDVLGEPVEVQTAPVSSPATAVTQSLYFVGRQHKPKLLARVLRGEASGRTLVFSRTKHGADKLVRVLAKAGIDAAAIHGNKAQNARTRALEAFRAGRTTVLVATDIAARGIDVDDVTHVVNFDLPNVPETYVHRIGRTARAGASGSAISFCDPDDPGQVDDLRAIERLIDRRIDVREDEADLLAGAPKAAKAGTAARTGKTAKSSKSAKPTRAGGDADPAKPSRRKRSRRGRGAGAGDGAAAGATGTRRGGGSGAARARPAKGGDERGRTAPKTTRRSGAKSGGTSTGGGSTGGGAATVAAPRRRVAQGGRVPTRRR